MNWRDKLPQLEGFPLVPCGAGTKYKSPVDPKTGDGLKAWQTAAYTPAEIAAMNGVVKCVGTRCGPDAGNLCILDIDGESAIQVCKDAECSSRETGWTIHRTTSKDRLKVAFYIPEGLLQFFHDDKGNPVGKCVLTTKQAVYELDDDGNPTRDEAGRCIKLEDAEQLELFFATGQCIVLGEHVESGGQYQWHGSPAEIDEPTPEWCEILLKVLDAGSQSRRTPQ